jgi:adenylate cyclase
MSEGTKRRLVAVLAADVVGYSRLMGEDEAGTLSALRQLRTETLAPKVSGHRGKVVKSMGDGWLVEFASVADAVTCALDLQEGLARSQSIKLRIGVHLGDITHEDDDIYGDGVNIASRLQEIAEPGAIIISDIVRRSIDGKLAAAFVDLGTHTLKNIIEPVTAYGWGMTSISARASEPILPGKPSIAVLPFDNMSADPEQDYFADGMTEEIITLLSTVPELFVIARNSTFAYKGQSVDVRRVAEELGVRYVLEGSIRKAGNRIRVTAQFIDAGTGNHIWADHFDRNLEDMFAVQDEVAEGITGVLQSRLLIAESEYMSRKPPEKLDAWGNMIRARLNMFAYRAQDIDKAEPFARQALAIQSDYATAHAVLAQILAWRSYNGWTDDVMESAKEAMEHVRRALESDANNPTVLTDVAFSLVWLGLFLKAAPMAERAVQLNPSSALTCAVCGHALGVMGRSEESLLLTRKSFLLSPKDPLEYIFHMYEGSAQFFAGNLDISKRAIEHALRLKPDLGFAHILLAGVLSREGQIDAAKSELARVENLVSEDAIKNLFRPRTTGTRWRDLTDPIREIYGGKLPKQPE